MTSTLASTPSVQQNDQDVTGVSKDVQQATTLNYSGNKVTGEVDCKLGNRREVAIGDDNVRDTSHRTARKPRSTAVGRHRGSDS